MNKTPIACTDHNHEHCIEEALIKAEQLCAKRGARLTALRRNVLRLIWKNHAPLGAYDLMDMLAEEDTRRVAPPTVYRSLEFLLDQGLIHRINSLNAYVGCHSPSDDHEEYFLICRECGVAVEVPAKEISRAIDKNAEAMGFTIETQTLEVVGLCPNCK
ncbi:transcriptional repressor [Marinibactrum halimedae]|uniref:transcriptional repressor n=1 Tax=Marinibactrum halimedae TaxID=1444977 RepID=UPI002FCCDCD4